MLWYFYGFRFDEEADGFDVYYGPTPQYGDSAYPSPQFGERGRPRERWQPGAPFGGYVYITGPFSSTENLNVSTCITSVFYSLYQSHYRAILCFGTFFVPDLT